MKTLTALCLCLCSAAVFADEPRRISGPSTTAPLTQDRDKAIYNWQKRHEEILARHKEFKPDVVVFGDSIMHYWGGEPKAPKAWAAESWAQCFDGFKVTNAGMGWDRTENVLWRIENGELDGIEPKMVVVKIGTNNTGLNSAEDIAAGIEAVAAAVHEKQPKAKVLLLGVLTRRDEKPPRPTVTEQVNKILAAKLGDVPWLTVRDFSDAFRNEDGTPNAKLFSDGVHVNAAGYEILGAKIREQLLAILARRASE